MRCQDGSFAKNVLWPPTTKMLSDKIPCLFPVKNLIILDREFWPGYHFQHFLLGKLERLKTLDPVMATRPASFITVLSATCLTIKALCHARLPSYFAVVYQRKHRGNLTSPSVSPDIGRLDRFGFPGILVHKLFIYTEPKVQ